MKEDCFKKYPKKKAVYDAKRGQQIKDHKEQKDQKDKKSNEFSSASGSSGITLYAGALISSAFKDSWLVDTSASYHMTHDKTLLKDYKEPKDLPLLTTAAKGDEVCPLGVGTVKLTVERTDGSCIELTLKNIYYMP